jgi:fructokinase
LVDLICERATQSVAEADAFVPHFGGVVANVAVVAARAGAPVALLGGAGEDEWGAWLRDRLVRDGVDVSHFELIPGARTPLALISVDATGEPHYEIYGEQIPSVARAGRERLESAVRACAALFISSNTMVGAEERELTMRARAIALEHGRPVIFDPNLRLHRWRSRADAAASANACVPGALLVRANAAEAAAMTGEDDPDRAASALVKAGAQLAVVTLGAQGALLRGDFRAEVPGLPVQVRSTIGAGDVLTGLLLAKLATSDFYPAAVAASLPEAVAASARACERWGALD